MLNDELGLVLEFVDLLALLFEDVELLNEAGVLPFEVPDDMLH